MRGGTLIRGMYASVIFAITIAAVLCSAHDTSAACNVSTNPVIFGSYDVFSPIPLDSSGAVIVQCDDKPVARVTISIGPSPGSGSFDPRTMDHMSGTDALSYNLYTDTNRNKIWGDGSGNTFTSDRNVNRNKPKVVTMYGRIPPLQNVSAGSYADTLTVTINW